MHQNGAAIALQKTVGIVVRQHILALVAYHFRLDPKAGLHAQGADHIHSLFESLGEAGIAFEPLTHIVLDGQSVFFVMPAAVDDIVFRACFGNDGSILRSGESRGAVPGKVHVLVEDSGKCLVCREAVNDVPPIFRHLTNDFVEITTKA